jgi:hypothetical protein
VFNKLDEFDFTIDDKTGKVSIDANLNNILMSKLSKLQSDICEPILGNYFCNEQIICSSEYAYMYLYLSTCNKSSANSDPQIVSKIGQYELGKLQWNKKTSIEKSTYATSIVESLKKHSKLTTTLASVGFCIQPIITKYMTDQVFLYMVQKHLSSFQTNFNKISQNGHLLDVLNYANETITCVSDPQFLTTYSDITNILNDIATYINTYDYTLLDFQTKLQVLSYYREHAEDLFSHQIIQEATKKIIDFLTATLSQEIAMQLGSCETFTELIDRLYDCLDINDDIYVDQILLNHKTFKVLLFGDGLQTNIEYALSKFELDVKTFFLQIIEMKLTALLNGNDHNGMVESMLCVQEFLDTKPELITAVPALSKYRILLRYALSSKMHLCDKDLLINKIDNESTLYVENIYYDLVCTNGERDHESDTSDEETEITNQKQTMRSTIKTK